MDAAIVAVAGVGLTVGLWWSYFTLPSGVILHHFRNRAWVWAYGHILIFAAIAATGAGLHVVALLVEGEAHLSEADVVLAVAFPVLVYLVALFALYTHLLRIFDPFHLGLLARHHRLHRGRCRVGRGRCRALGVPGRW